MCECFHRARARRKFGFKTALQLRHLAFRLAMSVMSESASIAFAIWPKVTPAQATSDSSKMSPEHALSPLPPKAR